jgi:hypothetical protein
MGGIVLRAVRLGVLWQRVGQRGWPYALLLAGVVLLAWGAAHLSPTVDEVAHLPAGLRHWQQGRFDLYRVNPPLVRLVAALPVLAARPATDWSACDPRPLARSEQVVGRGFLRANRERVRWLFALGRWACIGFWLLGAVVVWRWAQALWGGQAGGLALGLWCACPNLLGHGMLLTPDVGGTALAVASVALFWCWLRQPCWPWALLSGLTLGLAQLARTTNILLLALLPVLWWLSPPRSGEGQKRYGGKQLLCQLLLAGWVLNAGYGFEGFGRPLGKYEFVSELLVGAEGRRGNRFRGTWLESLPVPLPANYVQGIDLQKWDFEVGRGSYLAGEFRGRGWWYYYLYGMGVKLPLGTLGIIVLGWWAPFWRGRGLGALREEAIWLLPGLGYLVFVSSQTGFSHHLRYVFPALPFFFVGASRLWGSAWWEVRWVRWLVGVLLLGSAVSGLRVYPHSLSYFNELAGGPLGGPRHLLDSNIDWGQDLYYLESWAREHPEARPLYIAYFNSYEPRDIGLEYSSLWELGVGPRPGWFAVSVNYVYGYASGDGPHVGHFRCLTPVAYAGYSIYIYHLDLAEANRLRREMGLPLLSEHAGPQ